MDNLPKYDVTIDDSAKQGDEELGIDMIAFTSDPAILVKGVAFKSQKKTHFADDRKYRITAPAMIPMDIYRADEDGEYEVTFKEEVIDQMHNKFMRNLNNKDLFNLEHDENQKVPAYILEAWIVDNPKQDKAYSTFGIEVPKGTLMVTAQVTDKDYYNRLVDNDQVGFSIEGFLALQVNEQSNNLNQYNMQLPDGEHLIEGKVYVVEGGNVVEIKEQEEVAMSEETVEVEASEDVELSETPQVEEVAEVEASEDVKVEEEVEMMEEPKEEEMQVDPATDAEAILSIVNPILDEKINEVLQVIADLKNEMAEASEEAQDGDAELEMSADKKHGFTNLLNFIKNG
jgi:hypothetical protein